jgi:hypothetical protein
LVHGAWASHLEPQAWHHQPFLLLLLLLPLLLLELLLLLLLLLLPLPLLLQLPCHGICHTQRQDVPIHAKYKEE